jgi:hypothetical protein
LIDADNEIRERPGAQPLPPLSGAIRHENVSFGYAETPF